MDNNISNELVAILSSLDPIKAASVFSGLLLSPELQSNNFRLEAIIQFILSISDSDEILDQKLINKIFYKLNGTVFQQLEDPAINLMINMVHHSNGSYRISEGSWVSACFFLQRFIESIESMPKNDYFFLKLNKSILALLKISDKIIDRTELIRYVAANNTPVEKIPSTILSNMNETSRLVMFNKTDFEESKR